MRICRHGTGRTHFRHLKNIFDPPVSKRHHSFSALIAADLGIEIQSSIFLSINDAAVCVPWLFPTPGLDHRTGSISVISGVWKHVTSAVTYA